MAKPPGLDRRGASLRTASEVVLAMKSHKPVLLLASSQEAEAFFRSLDLRVQMAVTPEKAIELIAKCLGKRGEGGPTCVVGR